MYMHIETQFMNVSQNNTKQSILLKRGNFLNVKIYPLNVLLILVSLFYFINDKIQINNFRLLCSNIIIYSTRFLETKI